jgi:hypothetical protein
MNDDNDLGQADEEIFTDTTSDEELEAASDAERRNPTGRYSVMTCC